MRQLNLSYKEGTVIFGGEHPKGEGRYTRTIDISDLVFDFEVLTNIFEAVCRLSGSYNTISSQLKLVEGFLLNFIKFIASRKIRLPLDSSEWQNMVFKFLDFMLLSEDKKNQKLDTRRNVWNYAICKVFDYLKEIEIIPLNVIIIRMPKKKEFKTPNYNLLGESSPKKENSELQVRKLLVNINYSRTDSDYLDLIYNDLYKRSQLLLNVSKQYFEALKSDHETGRRIAASISEKILHGAKTSGCYERHSGQPKANKTTLPKVTNQKIFSDGYVWVLARLRYLLKYSNDQSCISIKSLAEDIFFANSTSVISANMRACGEKLREKSALNNNQACLINSVDFVYRFSGILLNLDMVVLCVILIHENPNFNPESIMNAELKNKNGGSNVILTDTEGRKVFSIDKPRAAARKHSVLSDLSWEVLQFIIEATEPIRNLMKNAGKDGWRFLFLGNKYGRHLGPMKGKASAHLVGGSKGVIALVDLYPELKSNGLQTGTMSLASLRNTMGVIRWFESGSIREVAKLLGNSKNVVMEHYIPKSLLSIWSNRQIRRFQQTLIILAAHDEKFLLDVSDFDSFSDLTSFMAQMFFCSHPGRSPIDSALYNRLSQRFSFMVDDSMSTENKEESQFNLRLNPDALAILYCYADKMSKLSEDERKRIDPELQISPQHFINLSKMIRHVCESESVSGCGAELERLKLCHEKAMCQFKEYSKRFDHMSLSSTWG